MKKQLIRVMLLVCLTGIVSAQTDPEFAAYLAAERQKLPAAGELLYDCSKVSGYSFGSDNGATRKIVNADTLLPFSRAFQLDIKKAGENAWEPQFVTPRNAVTVNKNDVLFYIFYIRLIESEAQDGNGQSLFHVQKAGPPWTGLGSSSIIVRPVWLKYYVVASADQKYDPGQMEATFHLGYLRQKVEIGGIIALNLGANINVDDLPATPLYYDGMEPDAAWRAQAAANIEQHRKGDLTVLVKNINGQMVKNATVTVKMTKHAYGFGTFIDDIVLQSSNSAEKYRTALKELFNRATTPFYMGGNEDNWGWCSSETVKQQYTQMAEWLQLNDIETKGHVLIWPGWKWMPSFFEDMKDDPTALRNEIELHLDEVVPVGQEFGLAEWDVVNEPYINHDVMDVLGDEVLIDWYNFVHGIDSLPRLILNEYNILAGGGVKSFQDNLARVIELLQANNAPLGGIGLQSHFDQSLTGIPEILNTLDRFAQYNIPIQITEFDINTRDEETQAAFTRDFFTAVFSHPATDKIVMWGFWQGRMWKPNGAMIRTDWSYKPNYYEYVDLIFHQWWTDVSGVTNRDGNFLARGFLGDYTVSAGMEGEIVSKNVRLTKDGLLVELTLPITATEIRSNTGAPAGFGLYQNYPNPFNASTVIEFIPARTGNARFSVYNVTGTEVHSRDINVKEEMPYKLDFDARELTSGVYFYAVDFPAGSRRVKKMILLK